MKDPNHFALWLLLFAFSVGLFVLGSRYAEIVPFFLVLGYLAIFVGAGKAIIASRDFFNPLCLILLIGFVRYSCPAFLLLAGVSPPKEVADSYDLLGLMDPDWLWGHVLALTSLCGVALGWRAARAKVPRLGLLNFSVGPGVNHAAVAAMAIGFAALMAFILKNASLGALLTGALRGVVVEEGTGIYFRLIYLLIGGSIVLTAYLLKREKSVVALLPVLFCMVALLGLGGRGRAITPVLAGLLLVWYRRREQRGWPPISLKIGHLFIALPAVVLLAWLFHFGALYRGGYGLSALPMSLSPEGIRDYIQYSIFAEFGQLHGLAGAVAIGPGVLEGRTFLGSLTFPLPKLMPIPGRSAGVFIIETLEGFHSDRKWGLHASLIGDAYLNFGLAGILLIMPLFGLLARLLYMKLRVGTLNAALYAFVAIYGVNLFLKSIESWPHLLTGLVFMLGILRFGNVFSWRPRDRRKLIQTEQLPA